MPSEFDLIQDYFNWQQAFDSVQIGIGDDAAVLNLPNNKKQQLVVSVDTFIEGVHFPENTPADAIGHKALAVNLSDLAAMGAKPAWFTLALTLPEPNLTWLHDFSKGLKKLANQHKITLIGGDTTRGKLSITIQVMGFVERGKALLRSSAKLKDKIYVSGNLGDAAIGLAILQNCLEPLRISQQANQCCQNALNYPQPQNFLSNIIQPYANACLDISDGLLQDLGHILKASNLGACLNLDNIPLSDSALESGRKDALAYALTGGDDYQLLFTISEKNESQLLDDMAKTHYKISCIGEIDSKSGKITDHLGHLINVKGYQHF
ncbi:MAG TPA: thiamine-phosphate kinase [Leucothrix mucor]|uniref:Thiamine-monophosphate kinase n=1 Tax=Leucothrix mucor TaxID=45248 RepID=A0A7V2SZT0_LEUMU|nr:thiamine-phosphate kinase [Leucothrix mucor]